jgi:hypothetical protein
MKWLLTATAKTPAAVAARSAALTAINDATA